MFHLLFIYNDNEKRYYYGGTNQFQGKKYARLGYPKSFTSRKRAENAYKKLRKSCVNVPDNYEIEDCSAVWNL